MNEDPTQDSAGHQDWLEPLGEKSDALVNSAVEAAGEAGATAKDALINSRLLGHVRHPSITDIPFGSWTVTFASDVTEMAGQAQFSPAADLSVGIGLVASVLAAAGGLADLSETHDPVDRRLGMMHGIFQGVTMALYAGSLTARWADHRKLGRTLSLIGYGTLIAASYLAGELRERRAGTAA